MARMIALLTVVALASCSTSRLPDGAELADLGRNAETIYYSSNRQTGEVEYLVINQNESESFGQAANTVRHGIWAWLGSVISGDITGMENLKTVTDGQTEQLGITTEGATEQLAIESEAAIRQAELELLEGLGTAP